MKTISRFPIATSVAVTLAIFSATTTVARIQGQTIQQNSQPQQGLSENQGDVVTIAASGDKRPDDKRPVLGAIFQASANGLTVQSVFTNGPFHQQDIGSQDRLVSIDGKQIANQRAVDQLLLKKKPGDTIQVSIERDGKTRQLPVRLISQKELLKVSNTDGQRQANLSRQYVGQTVPLADALPALESRLKSLELEMQAIRIEIQRLKSQAAMNENR